MWVDNGKIFIAKAFKEYVKKQGIKLHYLDKCSPWQKGKIERLFGTIKTEWINYRRYKTPESLNNSPKSPFLVQGAKKGELIMKSLIQS